MKVRYIRDYLQGSTSNAGNHWIQIAAWDVGRANMTITDGASNRALNKTATSTDSGGSGTRTVNQLGDGDIATGRYFGGAGVGRTYVLMDLGAIYDIDMIQVWHYYGDARTYFQHEIDVSTDGSTYTVIQQPECNVRESSSGTYYHTFDAFNAGDPFYRWKHQSIEDALIRAAGKKNITGYAFTAIPVIGSPVPAYVFNEIRAAVNVAINGNASVVNADSPILASGWQTHRSDYYRYNSGSGACKTNCTFTCSISCSSYCGSACNVQCSTACAGGCGSSCNANCAGGCSAACGGACSAGGACSSDCNVSCVANCKSNCSCIFSGSCGSGCNYRCSGTCTASCGGACSGACSTACAGGTCGGACSNWCGGCSTVCGTQCGALCGTTCAKGCENSCTGFSNVVA